MEDVQHGSIFAGFQISAREPIGDTLKRRVYFAVTVFSLPGVVAALWATRSEGLFVSSMYVLLGLSCLYSLIKLPNPQVGVQWIERFGFAVCALFTILNLGYAQFFAPQSAVGLAELNDTYYWLVAFLCIFAFVVFETQSGLHLSLAIAGITFAIRVLHGGPALFGSDLAELIKILRHTSLSSAMVGFVYILALTKEQLSSERLRSSTDELTGLLNRRATHMQLEAHLLVPPTGVILLDIDHFKRINDSFGHAAGDAVLVGVAQILRQYAPQAQAGRWGGEEFLLVLPLGLPSTLACAEALQVALEMHVFDVGVVTASFGVTVAEAGDDLGSLVRRADLALYAAKARGRNRVEHALRSIECAGDWGAREAAALNSVDATSLNTGAVSELV